MKLFYRSYGQGPALLILHGLFGSSDNWQTMGKMLSSYFTVYLADLRNHGQSPHSEEWNYALMARDVEELCHDLSINQINIAGHSMGGKVVMHLAQQSPQLIKKMMILDIAPRYYAPHHQQIIQALSSVDFDRIKSRKAAEEQLGKFITEPSTLQFLLKNLYWKSPDTLGWRFNLESINRNIDEVGKATDVKAGESVLIPALFIKGERSSYITPDDERLILKQYPLATIKSIPGAGHWVHADQPDLLFAEFHTFFF